MAIKAIPFVVLAAMPWAAAGAQDWAELDTLTFVPVGLEPSVSARVEAAGVPRRSGAGGSDPSRNAADASAASSEDSVLPRIRDLTDRIAAERAAGGENSPELVPQLTELAEIYQQLGDYGDAIAALEQAQQIVRRWEGLYSLDQAAVIERMIEIEMEIAPGEQVTELESILRELVRRNPGDDRNVALLIDMAERQMDVVRHVLIHGVPPEFTLNIDAGLGPGGPRFTAPRTTRSVAASTLRRARSSYAWAMNEAMNEGPADIPLLLELEGDIIDSYYFELMNQKLRRRSQPYNVAGQLRFGGVNALEAKLENSRNFPGTPEAVTAAQLELADWHLMFLSFGRAMDLYDSALDYLRSEGGSPEQVAALFTPETPVPLPAFVPNASVFSRLADVRGQIDVEIEINRFGGVRRVEVIGASENATPAVERRLKRFLHQSRFRPRFVDGEWQRRDRFTMRYEFGFKTT